VDFPSLFLPPRKAGILFQSASSLMLLGAGGSFFALAVQSRVDIGFLIFLLLSLLLFIPIPLLVYRLYALLGATYRLERDGLHLHWGLRHEDVPLPEIEWVRPAADLAALVPAGAGRRGGTLPLPWLRWPGALLGTRSVEGLGTIEFLAADTHNLLLVAIPHKIYAISPTDPAGFVRSFRRMMELGSLTPIRPQSVYPTVMVSRLWSDRAARTLLIAGLALVLVLLAWVGLLIPTHPLVSLGFSPTGAPLDPSSGERLLLLPVLSAFTYVIDLAAGVFFYRRRSTLLIAYLLWAASVVGGIAMLVGLGFIIQG
jgi:hypothetical protein